MSTRFRHCGPQRSHRIAPDPSSDELLNIIEIRKGRWLHIQHILPTKSNHPNIGQARLQDFRETRNLEFRNVTDLGNSHGVNIRGDKNGLSSNSCTTNNDESSLPQNRGSDGRRRSSVLSSVSEQCKQNDIQSNTPAINQSISNMSNLDSMSLGSLHSVLDDGNTAFFFIHGVGGCSDLWKQQIAYFVSQGYEVIAPDLLGHGFSWAPHQSKAYTFSEHADDLLAVFDRFCKKRNILVGHSYGACFCTKIARERARKVTKLVLISGGGPICLEPEVCQLFCLPSFVLSCIKPIIVNGFLRQAFHRDNQRTKEEKSRSFDIPAYVLRATMQGQNWKEGGEEYHAALSASVLLIYGIQDELVLLDDEKWMNETIYASQLETLENASHMVMIEQPDKVNGLIHDFVLKDTMVHRRGICQRTMSTRSCHSGHHGKTIPHVTIT